MVEGSVRSWPSVRMPNCQLFGDGAEVSMVRSSVLIVLSKVSDD